MNIGQLTSIFSLKIKLIMSFITGVIEALKKQRHPFLYRRQRQCARRRSWLCCVVLAQVVSRQADSLMARQHGGTDSTHSTCRQRVGKDRPCRQNLLTMSFAREEQLTAAEGFFSQYANLLTKDARYHSDKIVKAQCDTAPWIDLQGKEHKHLLTVF